MSDGASWSGAGVSPRPDARAAPLSGGLLIGCIALLFCLQVYAFHWGVITPDTVFQWGQALSGRYDDWHPPATTWLWRQLMMLGPGTAPVLLFQTALYWTGVGLIAEVLRRRGRTWAMTATVLVAALPIPFGQMGAILKDPLLGACCLVAAGLLFAFRERPGGTRVIAFVVVVILLQFASATRFNAMFATAPLLIAWAPERWLASPVWLVAMLAATGLLLFGGGRAINDGALRPHHSEPIFSLVNFDFAGIVAQGGGNPYPNMGAATAKRWTALCYDARLYNPTYREDCDEVEVRMHSHVAAHRQSATMLWVKAIIASPGAYARHRLSHLNRNWRLWVRDVPDDAFYMQSMPDAFGIAFTPNSVTKALLAAARWMAWSPLGRPATWVGVAIGLLTIGGQLDSRRVVLALAGSALVYGCGYAVFSVSHDMRYNFWTMLAAMMALVIAAGEIGAVRMLNRKRLMLAAAPALLAVTAESLALFFA